jgi:peroxiredoxin Q/BCP
MKELRDSIKTFEDAETVVLGVSMDGVESHAKFAADLKLPFDLLADPEKKLHEAYGFKQMVRALVLIDKKGVIRFVNKKYGLKKEEWEALLKEVASLKEKKE